jgi:2-dehydro-3-deoxyphosphooctonate aldolase (KDO 8-P synthase)
MIPRVKEIKVGNVIIGGRRPLVLIAGICVIESREHTLRLASRLRSLCAAASVPLVFKASYDKANRTSIDSYRGPGLEEGLSILSAVRDRTGLPLLIDFHRPEDAVAVAETADILQVPAFLCRQTDMLLAAARTGKAVNVKKGQFLSPDDVAHVIGKIESAGNRRILITERGTSFGYHCLINDMKALPAIRALGYPAVFDATHSVQLPGGAAGFSGGQREYIPVLARSAAAAGCDALFLEVHDRPEKARSDAASVLPLGRLPELLAAVTAIDRVVKEGRGQ